MEMAFKAKHRLHTDVWPSIVRIGNLGTKESQKNKGNENVNSNLERRLKIINQKKKGGEGRRGGEVN